MSTAIMQTGAMGWDYKFHDWNDSNDVGDIQLKVMYSHLIFLRQVIHHLSGAFVLEIINSMRF